jgi:hypothetical protein
MSRYAVPEFAWLLLIVAIGLFGILTEVKP